MNVYLYVGKSNKNILKNWPSSSGEKGLTLQLNKLESHLPNDALCQDWLILAQWFLKRTQKCESLQTDRQRDGQTDRRSEKLTCAFSSKCNILRNFKHENGNLN